MGDIQNAWMSYRKHFVPEIITAARLEERRQDFFAGALAYAKTIDGAAQLADNLAEMVVKSLDAEVKRFEGELAKKKIHEVAEPGPAILAPDQKDKAPQAP